MGSYGIGVSRLAGGIIEARHDVAGIAWPEAVAPFKVGLINLRAAAADCTAACDRPHGPLQYASVAVLHDDPHASARATSATMELIGPPRHPAGGQHGLQAAAGARRTH